jgi:16S rRNA processing protein RimM
MFKKENLRLLGFLAKTNGVHGAYVLKLHNLKPEDVPDMESVFIEIDGLPVPYFISNLSDRDHSSMIIKFDDIDSKDKAEEFTGCEIYITADNISSSGDKHPGTLDITGYIVTDKKYGDIGQITGNVSIHNNPLLKVKAGNNEYLIPYNRDFILKTDHKIKTLYTDLPEGLLEI